MNELIKNEDQELRTLISGALKIRHLKNSIPITQGLAYCFKLTGLKTLPSDLERQVLIDFIVSSYGGMVAEEIKNAFKMACSGKFEVETNHYQNFSAEYLGRIMKAYNEWRAKKLGYAQAAEVKPYVPLVATEEENEAWLDTFRKPWRRSKQNQSYSFLKEEELGCYTLLEAKGIELVTLDRKKEMWLEEWPSFMTSRNKDKAKQDCKKYCRRLALKEFILTSLMEDRDLEKEL